MPEVIERIRLGVAALLITVGFLFGWAILYAWMPRRNLIAIGIAAVGEELAKVIIIHFVYATSTHAEKYHLFGTFEALLARPFNKFFGLTADGDPMTAIVAPYLNVATVSTAANIGILFFHYQTSYMYGIFQNHRRSFFVVVLFFSSLIHAICNCIILVFISEWLPLDKALAWMAILLIANICLWIAIQRIKHMHTPERQ